MLYGVGWDGSLQNGRNKTSFVWPWVIHIKSKQGGNGERAWLTLTQDQEEDLESSTATQTVIYF